MDLFSVKYSRFTKCRRKFLHVTTIVIGIMIGMAMYYFYMLAHEPSKSDNKTSLKNECPTTECRIDQLREGLSILLYMNQSVSPCDNFYEFVCGNYEQVSNINNRKPFSFIQKSGQQVIVESLYDSMERINVTTEKSRHRKLFREYFDMCMDTKTREDRGIESLMEIIMKLGGWPVLEGEAWNEEEWRLEDVYNEAIKLGVPTDSFLFNIGVTSNLRNNSISLLSLKMPSLEFGEERMLNTSDQDKGVQGYYDFLMDIAVKGLKINRTIVEQELDEVFEFVKNLTQLSSHSNSSTTNITDLRERWNLTDWDTVFDLSAYGIEIDNTSEPIFVPSRIYLDFLETNELPKRVLANYQIWQFLHWATPYLNSEFKQIRKDYLETRYGIKSTSNDLRVSCIHAVRGSLPHIADAIFIQDYLNKDIRTEIMEMVTNIKEQIIKTFESISWLDQTARYKAIEKMNATKFLVAYPDEAFDDEILDKLYEDYELVEGDFLKTNLHFEYLSRRRKMVGYKTMNSTSYEALSSWIITNAYVFYNKNVIHILAGYLQDEHYNKNMPKYRNYGKVGSAIAHEMSHNFDSTGIFFDKDGNFFKKFDMAESVSSNYFGRIRCLIHHYNKYKYPIINKPVNGRLTMNENVADVNGVRLTYHTYQQWVKNHGLEPSLPHLSFTPNQLYWISFAHSMCTAFKNQTVIEYSYDAHATDDIRVMGVVSNSPEFAADFNCPINSRMNPKHKCTFW